MKEIREQGHKVILDWTVLLMIKPYEENTTTAGEYAVSQIQGIIDADVYIVLAYVDGMGVFVELGAALAIAQLHGKLKIFALAETIPPAMFHYHPLITWVKSLDEVLEQVVVS